MNDAEKETVRDHSGQWVVDEIERLQDERDGYKSDLDRIANAVYPNRAERINYRASFMIAEIRSMRLGLAAAEADTKRLDYALADGMMLYAGVIAGQVRGTVINSRADIDALKRDTNTWI